MSALPRSLLFVCLSLVQVVARADDMSRWIAQFPVAVRTDADAPVTVKIDCALPDHVVPQTRVVFVIPGALRNAGHYRDLWVAAARRYGYLVVVPDFSKASFPGFWRYQMGHAFTSDREPVPPSQTTFAAIETVFQAVRTRYRLQRTRYDLFGHSAGAQFVHRMVLFDHGAHIDLAIAANAGTYTVPDTSQELPFGIADAGLTPADLQAAFATRLIVMAGGLDTNPHHHLLNRSPGAMVQGDNRLQRAEHFFAAAQRAAARQRLPFAWTFQVIPGVGHSAKGMGVPAAKIFGAQT